MLCLVVDLLDGGEDVDDSDNSNDRDGYDKHRGVL